MDFSTTKTAQSPIPTHSRANASTGSCGATATANGYAVIMGGSSGRVRLVRFTGGLRNGAITDIATSGGYDPDSFFSVRVSYNATNNQWRLEARDDGNSFASPAPMPPTLRHLSTTAAPGSNLDALGCAMRPILHNSTI